MILWLIPAAIIGGIVGSELGSRRLDATFFAVCSRLPY
jgi:hypothetical protein